MEWKQATQQPDGAVHIPARWLYLHYYEAMTVLFRLENALRVFVYVVLKNECAGKWADMAINSEDGDGTIASIAKKRRSQAGAYGYLGYPVSSPLLYLTTGELTRLIVSDAYWKYFAPYFQAARNVVTTKFDEINAVRNAFAHFRPIRTDDLDTVKQSSKHILTGVAEELNQLLACRDTVPTNSAAEWYREVRTLGTPHCSLRFFQSADQAWQRIDVAYSMPVISNRELFPGFFTFTLPNLSVPSVLKHVSGLRPIVTYAIEDVGWVRVNRDGSYTPFSKTMSLGFSSRALAANASTVKAELEALLSVVESETELIQNDSLARGEIVRPVSVYAQIAEGKDYVYIEQAELASGIRADDPVEWWGNIDRYVTEFVSMAQTYPWMPTEISAPSHLD